MRLGRLLLGLAAALSFLVLVPSTSYACSCVPATVAQYVEGADVVVTGTVESRDEGPRRVMRSSGDPVSYRIRVDRVLKGRPGPSFDVESAAEGASCGIEVSVGRSYVFFVDHDARRDRYTASLCGGTAPASAALVERVQRFTGGPRPPDDSGGAWPVVVGGLLVTMGAVAISTLVVLRRRRNRSS